jgi:hypothetical protein
LLFKVGYQGDVEGAVVFRRVYLVFIPHLSADPYFVTMFLLIKIVYVLDALPSSVSSPLIKFKAGRLACLRLIRLEIAASKIDLMRT